MTKIASIAPWSKRLFLLPVGKRLVSRVNINDTELHMDVKEGDIVADLKKWGIDLVLMDIDSDYRALAQEYAQFIGNKKVLVLGMDMGGDVLARYIRMITDENKTVHPERNVRSPVTDTSVLAMLSKLESFNVADVWLGVSAIGGDGELGRILRTYLQEAIDKGKIKGVFDHRAFLLEDKQSGLAVLNDVLGLNISSEVSTYFLRRLKMSLYPEQYVYGRFERKKMVDGWEKVSGAVSADDLFTEVPRGLNRQLIRNGTRDEYLMKWYFYTPFFRPSDVMAEIHLDIRSKLNKVRSWRGIEDLFRKRGYYTELNDPNNEKTRQEVQSFLGALAQYFREFKQYSPLYCAWVVAEKFPAEQGMKVVAYLAEMEKRFWEPKRRYYIFKSFIAYMLEPMAAAAQRDIDQFFAYMEPLQAFLDRMDNEQDTAEAALILYALLRKDRLPQILKESVSAAGFVAALDAVELMVQKGMQKRRTQVYFDDVIDPVIVKAHKIATNARFITKDAAADAPSLQPSYIVADLEKDGGKKGMARALFAPWSVIHELGNLLQARVTGRWSDIDWDHSSLFAGIAYKSHAPPCYGGIVANVLAGAVFITLPSIVLLVFGISQLLFAAYEVYRNVQAHRAPAPAAQVVSAEVPSVEVPSVEASAPTEEDYQYALAYADSFLKGYRYSRRYKGIVRADGLFLTARDPRTLSEIFALLQNKYASRDLKFEAVDNSDVLFYVFIKGEKRGTFGHEKGRIIVSPYVIDPGHVATFIELVWEVLITGADLPLQEKRPADRRLDDEASSVLLSSLFSLVIILGGVIGGIAALAMMWFGWKKRQVHRAPASAPVQTIRISKEHFVKFLQDHGDKHRVGINDWRASTEPLCTQLASVCLVPVLVGADGQPWFLGHFSLDVTASGELVRTEAYLEFLEAARSGLAQNYGPYAVYLFGVTSLLRDDFGVKEELPSDYLKAAVKQDFEGMGVKNIFDVTSEEVDQTLSLIADPVEGRISYLYENNRKRNNAGSQFVFSAFPARMSPDAPPLTTDEKRRATERVRLFLAEAQRLMGADGAALDLEKIGIKEAEGDILAAWEYRRRKVLINFSFAWRAPPQELLIVLAHELYHARYPRAGEKKIDRLTLNFIIRDQALRTHFSYTQSNADGVVYDTAWVETLAAAVHQLTVTPAFPARPVSPNQLLKDFYDGDDKAFTQFYKMLYPKVLRGPAQGDEDVTQETFLRVFQSRGHAHFDFSTDPRNWVRFMAHNLLVDKQKKSQRQVILSEALAQAEGFDGSVEDRMIRDEEDAGKTAFVRVCLRDLPEEHGWMLRLRYFDELSYKEMAGQAGMSVDNIRIRLHRAKVTLKAVAEKYGHMFLPVFFIGASAFFALHFMSAGLDVISTAFILPAIPWKMLFSREYRSQRAQEKEARRKHIRSQIIFTLSLRGVAEGAVDSEMVRGWDEEQLAGCRIIISAKLDGRLIGQARCGFTYDPSWYWFDQGSRVLRVYDLRVIRKYRRAYGIGRQLMIEAVRFSREAGFGGTLDLLALPGAEGFYRKLGFESDGGHDWLIYMYLMPEQAEALLEKDTLFAPLNAPQAVDKGQVTATSGFLYSNAAFLILGVLAATLSSLFVLAVLAAGIVWSIKRRQARKLQGRSRPLGAATVVKDPLNHPEIRRAFEEGLPRDILIVSEHLLKELSRHPSSADIKDALVLIASDPFSGRNLGWKHAHRKVGLELSGAKLYLYKLHNRLWVVYIVLEDKRVIVCGLIAGEGFNTPALNQHIDGAVKQFLRSEGPLPEVARPSSSKLEDALRVANDILGQKEFAGRYEGFIYTERLFFRIRDDRVLSDVLDVLRTGLPSKDVRFEAAGNSRSLFNIVANGRMVGRVGQEKGTIILSPHKADNVTAVVLLARHLLQTVSSSLGPLMSFLLFVIAGNILAYVLGAGIGAMAMSAMVMPVGLWDPAPEPGTGRLRNKERFAPFVRSDIQPVRQITPAWYRPRMPQSLFPFTRFFIPCFSLLPGPRPQAQGILPSVFSLAPLLLAAAARPGNAPGLRSTFASYESMTKDGTPLQGTRSASDLKAGPVLSDNREGGRMLLSGAYVPGSKFLEHLYVTFKAVSHPFFIDQILAKPFFKVFQGRIRPEPATVAVRLPGLPEKVILPLLARQRPVRVRWVLEFSEIELVVYGVERNSGVSNVWEKFLGNRSIRPWKIPVRVISI